MRGFLLRFLVNMLALWLTGLLAQKLHLKVEVHGFWAAFSAVVLLGFANAVIAPILRLITLPINCMTLGLVGVLINAFLFWMVGLFLRPGFEVQGFWAAIFGSVVMGILNGLLMSLLPDRKR